jgi:hypothetical protein
MIEILLFILALLVLGAIARGIQALADMVNMLGKLFKPRRKPGIPPPLPNYEPTRQENR